MSEFKVGDRVITRWGEEAREWGLRPGDVPDGEHTILEAGPGDAISVFLDCKYWYPTCLIEKIDDSPENNQRIIKHPVLHVNYTLDDAVDREIDEGATLDDIRIKFRISAPRDIDEVEKRIKKRNQSNQSFRDECAMRAMEAMQADWSSNGVANPGFVPESTDESLEKWAALYYRMADAMMKARVK